MAWQLGCWWGKISNSFGTARADGLPQFGESLSDRTTDVCARVLFATDVHDSGDDNERDVGEDVAVGPAS